MDVTLKTTEEVERFFQETDNVLLGPPPKMKNAQIVFTEKAHTGKCILCCGEDVTLTGGKLVFAGPGAIVYLCLLYTSMAHFGWTGWVQVNHDIYEFFVGKDEADEAN